MTYKWNRLKEPFKENHIEWRIQRSGVQKDGKTPWAFVLAYVTNRAIMDRLDEVFGPENWQNTFQPAPDGGVMCGISVWIKDRWVTKYDGAENTNVEAVKGGLSSAMKRTAVQWGIGRYLYGLDANFAIINEYGKHQGVAKSKSGNKVYFKWDPPALPNWALPNNPVNIDKNTKPIQSITKSNKLDSSGQIQSETPIPKNNIIMETGSIIEIIEKKYVSKIEPLAYSAFCRKEINNRELEELTKDEIIEFGKKLKEEFGGRV